MTPELKVKFQSVRALLLDVDGVLTNGQVFHVAGQGWTRTYHVHDGYGIKLLQKKGIPVAIISGGQSEELKARLKMLEIEHFVLGSEDKLSSAQEISKKLGIKLSEMAFMGDELFDLPALNAVGLSIAVPNARPQVKAGVDFVTQTEGGQGAVREVIDLLIEIQKR